MKPSVSVVHELVSDIEAVDLAESEHRADALAWLASTDDVFRRVKPSTPGKHLVSYVVMVDPIDRSIFLVDHINAGLWLPSGGHVEPDENPTETARREAVEELGVTPDFSLAGERPLFVTVTNTVGIDHGHTDVSLWYAFAAGQDTSVTPDPREFKDARWWTADEIDSTPDGRFDPHFRRFTAKLRKLAAVV